MALPKNKTADEIFLVEDSHTAQNKEQTPVLLLMEVLCDEDDHHSAHGENKNECKGEEECKGPVDSKIYIGDLLDIPSKGKQTNAELSRPITPPPFHDSSNLIDLTGDISSLKR
eukprot:8152391-Ditylum_brightwellii.AAC.1